MTGSAQIDLRRSDDFWFDDGNVVLVASGVGYRLHGGILARHSPVFRDMLAFSQPDSSDETIDGCPVVHLTDEAEAFEHILHILYDGGAEFYDSCRAISFGMVRAALEIGSKYQIESVRGEALRRLRICFPPTLAAFHKKTAPNGIFTHSAPVGCPEQPIIIRSIQALAVVNLARRFDLPELLPAAFYTCSTLSLDTLSYIQLNDSEDVTLTPADLFLCFKVREAMIKQSSHQLSFLFDNGPQQRHGPCTNLIACDELRERVLASAYGDSRPQVLVHPCALLSLDLKSQNFCPECSQAIVEEYQRRREETWALLGELVGVSPWPPNPEQL